MILESSLSHNASECNEEHESQTESETEGNDSERESEEFRPGPLGKKFMDFKQTLNVFRGPYAVFEEIPPGRKDGMYFVIDNSPNISKRQNGVRSEFWDDCGVWQNSSTPITMFIYRENVCFCYQTWQCILHREAN